MQSVLLAQQVNLVLDNAKGRLEIRRADETAYRAARISDVLSGQDWVRLTGQNQAEIICRNDVVWSVPRDGSWHRVGANCPESPQNDEPELGVLEAFVRILRGEDVPAVAPSRTTFPDIPYLISPRNMAVLDLTPDIRWNAVDGATSYQVTIDGQWTVKTTESFLEFPVGKLPLVMGETYWLTVEADTGVSSEQESSTFVEILGQEERDELLAALQDLLKLDVSQEIEVLLEAKIYRHFDLYGEATKLLGDYLKTHQDSIAHHRLLADVFYEDLGLMQSARTHYEIVAALTNDEISVDRAVALERLGEIAQSEGKNKMAIDFYRQAEELYLALENSEEGLRLRKKHEALQ